MRTAAALLAGRAAGWASRVTGRGAGTQVSGRVMLAIDPHVLTEVARGRHVAIVSATNGKTTTTHLLAEALRACGTSIVTNHTGANMPAGVAAALGRDPEPDVAILEVDERWVPKVVDPLDAEVLILGNLTRDQLDRFGEVRSIAARWRLVCDTHPKIAVVANASDPHVVWSVGAHANVTWVALGAPWRSDAATCPECAGLLTWSGLRALILPAITLGLYQMTLIMRLTRAEMLEVLRADFIRFARARGLTDRAVHFRHALRNALVPVITVAGLQLGSIIAFAIITETVFQWPGMGLLFIQSVTFADVPVMAAYLCLIAVFFVVINFGVDLLYRAVDPRLRPAATTH